MGLATRAPLRRADNRSTFHYQTTSSQCGGSLAVYKMAEHLASRVPNHLITCSCPSRILAFARSHTYRRLPSRCSIHSVILSQASRRLFQIQMHGWARPDTTTGLLMEDHQWMGKYQLVLRSTHHQIHSLHHLNHRHLTCLVITFLTACTDMAFLTPFQVSVPLHLLLNLHGTALLVPRPHVAHQHNRDATTHDHDPHLQLREVMNSVALVRELLRSRLIVSRDNYPSSRMA